MLMFKKNLIFVALGFGTLGWVYSQSVGLFHDSHPMILALIYFPAFTLTLYSSVRKLKPWPDQLQSVGIPLGIFASIFFFIYDLQMMSDHSQIFSSIGRSFLAIFHGGAIAAFGYLFSSEQEFDGETPQILDITVLVCIGFSLPVLGSWLMDIGLASYLHGPAFLIFMVPFFFLIGAKSLALSQDKLLKATVVGMLGTVLLSMIMWLDGWGDPRALGPAAAGGVLGILYGALTLLLIGATSQAGELRQKATWRASWHALEIYALLILIIYAPPSFIEAMQWS